MLVNVRAHWDRQTASDEMQMSITHSYAGRLQRTVNMRDTHVVRH